ncbi:hypothetical protein [Haloferula sp.]|uniref:hypothetical protein n=1 Tax=Haloferula sp. TaxID=2497595 RepID=UPI00329AAD43
MNQDRQAEQVIREQLAHLLSESETTSLDEILRACRRLNDPDSVERLLSDLEFGWAPLVEGDDSQLFGRPSSRYPTPNRLLLQTTHEALFERWGQLDFDGALERIAEVRGPNTPGGDFSGRWSSASWIYKGGASVDGARAFEAVIFSDWSEATLEAVKPLMEGWASSDPEAAWDTMRTSPLMIQEWGSAASGFFRGLPEATDWSQLSERLELASLGDGSMTTEGNPSYRPHFERELTKRWICDDPDAAMAWYSTRPPSKELSGSLMPIEYASHARILAHWQRADPEAASTWLENWQPTHIDKGMVLRVIESHH